MQGTFFPRIPYSLPLLPFLAEMNLPYVAEQGLITENILVSLG